MQINVLFTLKATAKIPNVVYTLPPIRNAVSVPNTGDAIKLAGLESFTFAVVGRQWTYSGDGNASLALLLDLVPESGQPKSPILALVPPPTDPKPGE